MGTIKKSTLEERILDFEDAITAAGGEFYNVKTLFGDIAREWLQNQFRDEVELLAIAVAIESWLRDGFAKVVAQYASREKYAGSLEDKVNTIVRVAKNRLITAKEAWSEGREFYSTIYGSHHELKRKLMKEASDEEIMASIHEIAAENRDHRRRIRA